MLNRTRLIAAVAAAASLLTAAGAHADANQDRLDGLARDCIARNAADVERATNNLTDATDFLLTNLCALEMRARDQYQSNTSALENWKKPDVDNYTIGLEGIDAKTRKTWAQFSAQQKAKYAAMSVDPNTGAIVGGDFAPYLDFAGYGAQPAAEFRAYAARAVLDARKARLAAH